MITLAKALITFAFILFAGSAFAQAPIARGTLNSTATISNGNAFQTVLNSVASSGRKALTIQNNNTNGDSCWLFIGPLASATKGTSILLGSGGSYQRYYPYLPSDQINATCATTNDTLYIDTQ